MRRRFLVLVAIADQGVDQHHPSASELLFLPLPAGSPRTGVAAARRAPGVGEVPQERDVVVLSAYGARGDRKLGESFVTVSGRAVVLGREPQPRAVGVVRERHHRTANAAHEPMHDGSQQRPSVAARRGGEGQPSQDLCLGHRAPDLGLEDRRQFVQGARGRQRLVQPEHDLVA